MQLPSFLLSASDDKTYSEQDFQKGKYILYIYPKDMTPGCSREAQDFQRLQKEFQKLDIHILGLSKDSVTSHKKFCQKESLSFPLLSDPDGTLIKALGAWKEKSMYGKKYMGIDRSTLYIQNGKIQKEWRGVKATGHAEEVLHFCKKH
ncbi:peroxiredoxin [Candidatus Gracilibacteria bacterium]|nr:peroxiredoxin [Candidatus Gracilibacteria bacterium]MCF7819150.1 peroxiredoxin [Candidatus Gracilibacteria bacterium]